MPEIESIPAYFKPYVSKVQSTNVHDALEENWEQIKNTFVQMSNDQANYAYAEDKWTPKQIVQHLIDTERILSQRALRFARKDMTQLPGFDHDNYVTVAKVDHRSMQDLWEEFNAVRTATRLFYRSLQQEELNREGFANGLVLSVENQGFIIAGHAMHHTQIVKERYLV